MAFSHMFQYFDVVPYSVLHLCLCLWLVLLLCLRFDISILRPGLKHKIYFRSAVFRWQAAGVCFRFQGAYKQKQRGLGISVQGLGFRVWGIVQ